MFLIYFYIFRTFTTNIATSVFVEDKHAFSDIYPDQNFNFTVHVCLHILLKLTVQPCR